MRKIFILFKREYLAAVKTKSFVISLVLVPIFMAGSFVVIMIMDKNEDTDDKKFAVIDHSGIVSDVLKEAAKNRNENEIFNKETGEKSSPAYILDFIEPNNQNPLNQRLEISEKIRAKEYTGIVEIGKDIYTPNLEGGECYLRYYSESSFMDDVRHWFGNTINNYLRQERIQALNLPPETTSTLFAWTNIEA
ncbi:MAG: ABC transporter permease, partial [Bacteroidales bacterium]|nr:ABC transporter permease [Bacteroidales bacterium]